MATEDGWEPVPFLNAWIGHLMIGALKLPVVLLCLWGLLSVFGRDDWTSEDLFAIGIISVVVGETVATGVSRVFVRLTHKNNPPGILPTLCNLLAICISSVVVGILVLGTAWYGFLSCIASGLVEVGLLLWTKPWRGGMEREEVREKWEETKELTEQVFSSAQAPELRNELDRPEWWFKRKKDDSGETR